MGIVWPSIYEILGLSGNTFPEKLTTKNMEQQKRIQYFTNIPFKPEISMATIGDGWLSSSAAIKEKKNKRKSKNVKSRVIYVMN